MNRTTINVTDISNQEFLDKYASPGRIGLAMGPALINKALARAQRHLDPDKEWGHWSHAFLFEGTRHDNHHWVIESDLEVHHRHIRLGVQENRVAKFHNDAEYTSLAVLDFELTPEQISCLLSRGLDLVAARVRYSLRELVGTLIALRHPSLRGKSNPLARPQSFYCSAFVHHLFRSSGLDLAPGLEEKHTTPEHLWLTLAPHTAYVLQRPAKPKAEKKMVSGLRKLRRRVKDRFE